MRRKRVTGRFFLFLLALLVIAFLILRPRLFPGARETALRLYETGYRIVMVADGTMKERRAETASGTPMECPPPRTRDTVGLVMLATISAMASPASTSPPMVLRTMSMPSISSLSSMVTPVNDVHPLKA